VVHEIIALDPNLPHVSPAMTLTHSTAAQRPE
jgi:hypothetical protein